MSDKKLPLGMKLNLSLFVIIGSLLLLFSLFASWDSLLLRADNLLYLIVFVLPILLIYFLVKKLGKIKLDATLLMLLIYYLSALLYFNPQYLYGGAALSLTSLGIIMVIWTVLSLAFKFILSLSDNLAILVLLGFLEIVIAGWGIFFLNQEWLIPFLGFVLMPLFLISFPFLLLAITKEFSKKLDKEIN